MLKGRNARWRTVHHWHRVAGLVSALFVLLLAGTGLLLNHSDELRLDRRHVGAELLLDLYDIRPPAEPIGFRVGQHWVTQLGERLYYDARELPERADRLIGAVQLRSTLAVAVAGRLLLLSSEGELIERLGDAEGVPAGMQRLGVAAHGRLVIRAAHGDYSADPDTLEWVHATPEGIAWAEPAPPPEALRSRLLRAYRGTGLPLERVLLDLHSGRILGPWGVYLVDGAAALFLLLALTGLWMWSRGLRGGP